MKGWVDEVGGEYGHREGWGVSHNDEDWDPGDVVFGFFDPGD